MFQSLNVKTIFGMLNGETSELLVEQLNNSLDQGIIRLKKAHFGTVFTFMQVLVSKETLSLQEAITLNHFFCNA